MMDTLAGRRGASRKRFHQWLRLLHRIVGNEQGAVVDDPRPVAWVPAPGSDGHADAAPFVFGAPGKTCRCPAAGAAAARPPIRRKSNMCTIR
jgi:hypothetical protein